MKHLALILSLLLPAVCWSGPAQLKNARIVDLDDRTQVILDLNGPVKYDTLLLRNPARLVADLYDTRPRSSLNSLSLNSPAVSRVRFGIRDGHHLRVVLDLAAEGRTDARLLSPDGRHGHRLVLEVYRRGGGARTVSRPVVSKGQRQYVVAIDAGHGGKDPGAVGPKGTREKDVTLAVARRLKTLIDREPGMRAVLTRSDDRYLKLRERIYLARKHKADLFVSIHADAFADPKARGSSVFILSTRGASSEAARVLANRENAADLMGGYNLTGKDDDVAYVVLDLFQEATREASLSLADKVLGRLGKVGNLHKNHVEHAGFAVLKSPDMPSILVETAFITNPGEEEK
ncbi:MAG: N-acetylmuramoyl-L-alanine amidase, partial [Pseudomonadota bacterium]|nr:N-acetylmuramoyl-L-alanine amidase [Pseudomonadota bacterium]